MCFLTALSQFPITAPSLQQSQAEAMAVCICRQQQQTWQKCVTRATTLAAMAARYCNCLWA